MKKVCLFLLVPALILFASVAWATTYTTPMIDGIIGADWDLDEQFATMIIEGAEYTLWITWDYEAIYIGIDRADVPNGGEPTAIYRFLGDDPENLSLFVAIDTDPPVVPNSGTTLDGYQTVTFSGGHLPDYYYAFAGGGGWYEWAQWDVINDAWIWNGWRNDGTYYGWDGGLVDDELTILWDDIGRPEGIAVRVWITGETADPWPPAVLAAWPEENPVGVFPDLPWSYEFYAGHYYDALGPSFMPQPAMDIIPNITDHSVPVTLSSFSASGRDGAIEVSWTSQTEVNALAYHLLRSEAADGQFEEIARIDAHGNSEIALNYRYVDRNVVVGQTYYYQLADEDYEGNMKYHGMVFASAGSSVPGAYSLLPNYPNPFNPSTVIGYEIPEAGNVTVTIYNVLGQEIRTLVDRQHEAGTYHVMWDSKDGDGQYLQSGVYFYTLKAGSFTDTRKMVLMR